MQMTTQVVVEPPIREVFAFASTLCCWTAWIAGATLVQHTWSGQLDEGTTFRPAAPCACGARRWVATTVSARISPAFVRDSAGQAGNGEYMRIRRLNRTANVTQATPTGATNAAELDDISETVKSSVETCTQP